MNPLHDSPSASPGAAHGPSDRVFDVVVVGGGHAGCEAAYACARLGLHTGLVTVRLDDVAKMSCNPAIGGIAKGHMVRELDALGGLMGRITDAAGIQFKMLNRGRGPAVWSPRAQCDKAAYSAAMRTFLDGVSGLEMVAGVVNEVHLANGRVHAIELADGSRLRCGAAVITPGTFLNGLIHIGEERIEGGRIGEHAARALSECLAKLGLRRGRLKTGTPPRIERTSVDWAVLEPQPGDDPPQPFSHWTPRLVVDQVLCHLTRTHAGTHEVIRRNLHRSPLYSGQIRGVGPRYCPSIEDKVVKFADRESHQVFLEPEGRDVPEIYANGISSSLPAEVQLEFVRTMRGLEEAILLRPGYAVEYDYVLPHQLRPTLEVRETAGLFLAGQICGTSGYEEAAAQGWIAGVNAAHRVLGRDPVVLGREQAYLGVLVDDLVTREHEEPYRMFTSAAEHRLLLRGDNADERLAEIGFRLGLLDASQVESVREKYGAIREQERRWARVMVPVADPTHGGATHVRAIDLLSRSGSGVEVLRQAGIDCSLPPEWAACLEIRTRYRGYIERQERTAAAMATLEKFQLVDALWATELPGVSREAREKLQRCRPSTAGQASRIAGVSPADVAVLMVLARRCAARESTEATASA